MREEKRNHSNYSQEEKEALVKEEVARIKRIFKDLGKDKINAVQTLIKNAAFMTITLEDLQQTINREGVIDEYKNGENQWGTKKSVESEMYNTMIKNHIAIIKQISDLLPKDVPKVSDDGFETFVNDR